MKVKGQGHIMDLVRLEKASNVARDLFSDYDYLQKYQNILVKTVCTTMFQNVMAAIFQNGGHFQHENHFLDSFL